MTYEETIVWHTGRPRGKDIDCYLVQWNDGRMDSQLWLPDKRRFTNEESDFHIIAYAVFPKGPPR